MITYNKGRKTAILDDSAGQACICLQRYQHLDGRRSRDRNMAAPMKWERESSICKRIDDVKSKDNHILCFQVKAMYELAF